MDITRLSLLTIPAIKLFQLQVITCPHFKPSQSTIPTPSDDFMSPAPRSLLGTLQGHASR